MGKGFSELLSRRRAKKPVERIGNLIPTLRVMRNARISPLDVRVRLHCED